MMKCERDEMKVGEKDPEKKDAGKSDGGKGDKKGEKTGREERGEGRVRKEEGGRKRAEASGSVNFLALGRKAPVRSPYRRFSEPPSLSPQGSSGCLVLVLCPTAPKVFVSGRTYAGSRLLGSCGCSGRTRGGGLWTRVTHHSQEHLERHRLQD